eukprot:2134204-Amphidinium_carterae.1
MGYQKKHRRVPLPVVAFACGVSGRRWAREWLMPRELGSHRALRDCCPQPPPFTTHDCSQHSGALASQRAHSMVGRKAQWSRVRKGLHPNAR